VEHADELVRATMKREALTPAARERILDLAVEMLATQQCSTSERPAKPEAELREAEREHRNLISLVKGGKARGSVLAYIGDWMKRSKHSSSGSPTAA